MRISHWKNSKYVKAPAAALLIAGFVFVGCSGSKMRKVDVTGGEYYSQDEVEALSNRARNDYCGQLNAEFGKYKSEMEAIQAAIVRTRTLTDSTREAIKPVEQNVLQLESDIRALEQQIADVEAMPKVWKIRPGESLSLIASYDQIYNDVDKWERIFEANQDIIGDPYFIFPDTVLVIPRDWPTD